MSDRGFRRVVVLSIVMMGLLYGLWEYIEIRYLHDWDYDVAHGSHVIRGIIAGTILASIALGYVAMYKEKQERKLRQVHNEVVRLHGFQKDLLDSSPIGLITLDRDGSITYLNPAFSKLAGMQSDQRLSMNFIKDMQERCEDTWKDAIEDAFENRCSFDFTNMDLEFKDGKTAHVNAKGMPLKLVGNKVGLLLLIEDVTDKVRMEKEIFQFEKLASLGVLTGGLAHEINSPLGNMSIILERISRRKHGGRITKEVDDLHEQVNRINNIVEGLVEFSKRSGAVEDVLCVEDIIEYSLDHVTIPDNISIERVRTNDVMVEGDFEQLSRALMNILNNTVDALEDSEGPKNIWIWTKKENGNALISVQDSGNGIPEENLLRVFDPFFSTKSDGTGLGLSITYNIIKSHRGQIDVNSKRGLTEFRILLPLFKGTSEFA
jgi:polar amino acid transport system substrate-binding protein